MLLLPLGSVAEHNGRTTFVANLLAAGGIAVINPGPVTADDIADLATAADTPIAVICGTKQRYADDGPAALAAARAAGIGNVLLAGPEKEWPATESEAQAKPDGSLRVGIDAVATLNDLFDTLTTSTPAGSNTSGASA